MNNLVGTTYFVQTFGCQMNKHDSERVCGILDSLGSAQVSSIEESDIVVFMTCCVREAADVRLYGQVASLKNIPLPKNSQLSKRVIAIGGCIGQRDGEKLTNEMKHVDVVFGTHNLHSFSSLILEAINNHKQCVEILDSSDRFLDDLPITREHPWAAWLPITMGCNNFCTYCVVPYVRGREKSRPLEEIIIEAQKYIDSGVKEITLLGQNVNSYGRDLYGEPKFAHLLKEIDALGIQRLRFATSHPKDITDEVIEDFGKLKSLMPYLHLPFQSGSNRILELMNRRYTRQHYLGLIEKIRKVNPEIALSTDIIVGFPGETEEDFLDTLSLVKEVGFQQAFTFIYSKREGTPAAEMEQNASDEEIQDRFNRLVEAVQDGAFVSNQSDLGKTIDVIVEGGSKRDASLISGKSPKNQTVHAKIPEGKCAEDLIGETLKVRITEAKTWYLLGTIVNA